MKYTRPSLFPLLPTLVIALLLHACNWPVDTGGDQERPPQTKILNVLVQPDTVAPGDTARFTCIIKDSTDKRFEFYWYVDAGKVLNAELFDDKPITYKTDVNTIQWVAPEKPDFYEFGVLVGKTSKDSMSVEQGFQIVVQ